MMMKKYGLTKRAGASDMAVILLVGLLLFSVVALSATTYDRIVRAGDKRDTARRQLALIVGRLHNADGAAQIFVRHTRYGKALIIRENTDAGAVDTRYFKANGRLYEQTALEAKAVSVTDATPLSKTRVFRVRITGNVVTVTTDAGTAHVTLRGGTGQ